MTYDVYLGGKATKEWREEFIRTIDASVTIFDPIIEEYEQLDESSKANQVAMELEHIENASVVAFYLDEEWKSHFSMLQLGDAIGMGKQIVVCINGNIESEEKIRRYCEYRGVLIVETLEDLVTATEQFLAEMEICQANV